MAVSRINVGCQLVYEVSQPTSFVFNLAAAANDHQVVTNEVFSLQPPTDFVVAHLRGNQLYRLHMQPGTLTLCYTADVELTSDIQSVGNIAERRHEDFPVETLPFLNPSRYCESDRLLDLAENEFGNEPPGYGRVEAICDWANQHLNYRLGSTDASTTACDVLLSRAGVCRDFAHVCIAICRALDIPARYVSGYAVDLDPPDFHGFFEAYLGDRWYLFDPTRLSRLNGLVRIGNGRDAADTPFATIVGEAELVYKTISAETDGTELTAIDERTSGISTAPNDR